MFNSEKGPVPTQADYGLHSEIVSVTCDWCRLVLKSARPEDETCIEWSAVPATAPKSERVSVFIDVGICDRDGGGQGQVRSYHICPKCFADRLEPFLKSQGVSANVRDYVF